MSEYLSDLMDGVTDQTCRSCGAQSYYWIETDGFYGRDKFYACRTCGDRTLARLREELEADRAMDKAAQERLGFDPAAFCEDCGYRINTAKPYGPERCRCDYDPLREAPGYLAGR